MRGEKGGEWRRVCFIRFGGCTPLGTRALIRVQLEYKILVLIDNVLVLVHDAVKNDTYNDVVVSVIAENRFGVDRLVQFVSVSVHFLIETFHHLPEKKK